MFPCNKETALKSRKLKIIHTCIRLIVIYMKILKLQNVPTCTCIMFGIKDFFFLKDVNKLSL